MISEIFVSFWAGEFFKDWIQRTEQEQFCAFVKDTSWIASTLITVNIHWTNSTEASSQNLIQGFTKKTRGILKTVLELSQRSWVL